MPLAMFNAVNELVTCSSMSFVKVTDEAVLGQLAQLCQRYGIDAEKISCEYFSFANNTKATIKGKLIRGMHDFVESVHCSSFTVISGSPTLETLAPFENEKLKSLKPAGQRRPLDPIEVQVPVMFLQ